MWVGYLTTILHFACLSYMQSGKEFIILRLVDMQRVETEVTLFLFGAAYTKHWKTPVASLIGLMNPSFMKNGDSKVMS